MSRAGTAALALLVLALLVLTPAAQALTISTTGTFAKTRSDTVSWKTSNTLTINSLTVDADSIKIDNAELDFEVSSGTMTATITTWANDRRSFDLTTSDSLALVTFRMSNAGFAWTLYNGNTPITTCSATTSTCAWSLSVGTSSISVRLDETASGGGGGGGGGGGAGTTGPTGTDTPVFENPLTLFPRFNVGQWLTFFVSLVLLVFSIPPLRVQLPPQLQRIPLEMDTARFFGLFLLAFLYVTG